MIKYEKGTFNIVPNKDKLKGKPAEMQAIYFWICDHANEKGTCFPSRNLLASESGCNIKTVDKYIEQLINEGFMTKLTGSKVDSRRNNSNFYQVLIVGSTKNSGSGSTKNGATGSTENGAVIIPINNTQLTQYEAKASTLVENHSTKALTYIDGKPPTREFKFKEYMAALENSDDRKKRIIAFFWKAKRITYSSLAEANSAFKRNLRAAKELAEFTNPKIKAAIEICEEKHSDVNWGLETVLKVLTNTSL